MNAKVVVPWHNEKQKNEFLEAWQTYPKHPLLLLQQDTDKSGCARTKNLGIANALATGAEVICVLDDDCYPPEPGYKIEEFVEAHVAALKPCKVQMVVPCSDPYPRGLPYESNTITFPVAASMGFWMEHHDLDAITQLVLNRHAQPYEQKFMRSGIFGRMFPFCGMNFAFRREWSDCARLIDVPRWDDIWMGWIWEKVAYDRGACFNLNGPLVRHIRQSNVWKNLEEEIPYLKVNEDLWSTIYQAPRGVSPDELRKLVSKG
jgi:glycosyltransferase involved in cell wall biosynthesis